MVLTPATIASRDDRPAGRMVARAQPPFMQRPEPWRGCSAWLRRIRLRFRRS